MSYIHYASRLVLLKVVYLYRMPPKKKAKISSKKTFAASASQAAARIGNANFEEANEICRLIDANRAPELSEWQLNIQTRLDKSDNMLKEMHNMLATVIASNSSSAAPVVRPIVSGSAAAWAGVGPVTNDESPACAGDGPPACAGDGLPAASTSAATPAASTATATPTSAGPPWPTADVLLANDALPGEFGLPVEVRERVVTFASSALPIYVHVPENIRKKIWADEFVDMSLLLPQQQERQQFALSIVNNGNENRRLNNQLVIFKGGLRHLKFTWQSTCCNQRDFAMHPKC